jgi:hypothetical protein
MILNKLLSLVLQVLLLPFALRVVIIGVHDYVAVFCGLLERSVPRLVGRLQVVVKVKKALAETLGYHLRSGYELRF